jgi:hypothetical protein
MTLSRLLDRHHHVGRNCCFLFKGRSIATLNMEVAGTSVPFYIATQLRRLRDHNIYHCKNTSMSVSRLSSCVFNLCVIMSSLMQSTLYDNQLQKCKQIRDASNCNFCHSVRGRHQILSLVWKILCNWKPVYQRVVCIAIDFMCSFDLPAVTEIMGDRYTIYWAVYVQSYWHGASFTTCGRISSILWGCGWVNRWLVKSFIDTVETWYSLQNIFLLVPRSWVMLFVISNKCRKFVVYW